MMNLSRHILVLFLLLVSSIGLRAASVPGIDVVVSTRPGGILAYKGKTDARGLFETKNLAPGSYTVEMRSSRGKAMEGDDLYIAVSGGKKLVTAEAVPGGKLGGGGVAMIVEARGAAKITGQVVTGEKMVWLPPQVGSNFPGHWVERDSPELVPMFNRDRMHLDTVRKIQDKGRPLGL
jgi:hypothetical protein